MTRPITSLSQPLPEVSREQHERAVDDARQVARSEYPFLQRYAFYREGRWPSDEEFQVAELCDISPKGLALHLATRPTADMLVVELGVGTNVSRVLTKIVQVSPTMVAGERRYRVGCELVSTDSTS